MKKLIKKITDFYHSGDIAFYVSLIGPLTMGTIHLIVSIVHFNWIVVNYCIFSYLMLLFRVWQWAIEKYHLKPNNYIAGIISMLIVLAPMMAAFILTILYKDAPRYIFDWLIYAYATYGTIKMVFAIKNLCKKEKTNRQYVLSFFGLISALYTIQMMEFNLIKTFDEGTDNTMYLMQLFTQGAIFIVSLTYFSKKSPTSFDGYLYRWGMNCHTLSSVVGIEKMPKIRFYIIINNDII